MCRGDGFSRDPDRLPFTSRPSNLIDFLNCNHHTVSQTRTGRETAHCEYILSSNSSILAHDRRLLTKCLMTRIRMRSTKICRPRLRQLPICRRELDHAHQLSTLARPSSCELNHSLCYVPLVLERAHCKLNVSPQLLRPMAGKYRRHASSFLLCTAAPLLFLEQLPLFVRLIKRKELQES